MQEWSIIKRIIESQNSTQLRESESQKYLEQLEDGYKSDFVGFKDHLKRFIKLAVKEHYAGLETQRKDLEVPKKKGLENLLYWKKPKTSQEKPEEVDWNAVENQLSDANVLSNVTTSIALAHIENHYQSAYRIAEMIPFRLGIMTQKFDSTSKSLNEIYYKDIFKKFLKNLQVTDLDSLEEDYIRIRASERCVGLDYKHAQQVEQIVERNIKKHVLDDLTKEERLNPHIQGSQVYLNLQNNDLDLKVIYDSSSGKIEIRVQGLTDLENCKRYFGNLTLKPGRSSSSYAGRSFDLDYNQEFSNYNQEAEKERIKTAIDEYRSEESPEQTIERFNLNDEQTRKMETRSQPLYDKLNLVQTEIRQAESEFVQHSTPQFNFTLVKRENLSKNTGNYMAEVILNSDGNKVNVNGKYTNIDQENMGMLDCLFT